MGHREIVFNLLRSRFSATVIVLVCTLAACCSPSARADPCTDPPKEHMSTMQPGDDMDTSMAMPTDACPLVKLTKNDPDPPLYSGIGSAHWYVPWGQDYFDQGLRSPPVDKKTRRRRRNVS
jgi:hypothetical protein